MTGQNTPEENLVKDDELELTEWVKRLIGVAFFRLAEGDLAGLIEVFRKLQALRNEYDSDPYLSVVETGSMMCLVHIAEYMSYRLEFSETLEHCSNIKEMIFAKTQRYIFRQETPRAELGVWIHLLRVLGQVKWKAPAEYRNIVMSPEEMIFRYLHADTRLCRFIKKYPKAQDSANSASLHWALDCGLQVLKVAVRHCPGYVADIEHTVKSNHNVDFRSQDDSDHAELKICERYCTGRHRSLRYTDLYSVIEKQYRQVWSGYRISNIYIDFLNQECRYLDSNPLASYSGTDLPAGILK